jgi:hypothetical protein
MILLALAFISGCATMQDRWSLVVNQNTRSNYENFIKEYPDSEQAKEAKKRIEDPDYAFMTTCQIGTKEAFEGFVNSYPSSEYTPTAKSYVEYLKETKSGDLKSYKRFIAQYPNHPFIMEAKTAIPILWLKEKGDKIGVVVNINQVIHKGIFGGGYGNVEGVRQRVWQILKKELDQQEIQVVLLDSLESSKIIEEGIKEVVIADYSESEPQQSPPSYTPPDYYSSGGAFRDASKNALKSIFYNPAKETILITIKRIKDGTEYYWGFSSLSSSVGKINWDEVSKAICNKPSAVSAIITLKGKKITDPEEIKSTEEILKQLKCK